MPVAADNDSNSHVKHTWNESRVSLWRTFATFWSFIVMGTLVAAVGALLPYIVAYYHLSYTIESLIFLPSLVGYTIATASTGAIHKRYGLRGTAIIGPISNIVSCIILRAHPPFPVLVIGYVFASYGAGLQDIAWNAYIGGLAHPNELLGFLHGLYGLGAIIGPLIATFMVTKLDLPWYQYYAFLLCLYISVLATSTLAFWRSKGTQQPLLVRTPATGNVSEDAARSHLHEDHQRRSEGSLISALFHNPQTLSIICSSILFIIFNVGVEATTGGWLTTYMLHVRHADAFRAGATASSFWSGYSIGRLLLGLLTPRIGELRAIAAYASATIVLELAFAFASNNNLAIFLISLQGFFIGPMFPAAVLVLTSQLPVHLHIQSVALLCMAGQVGAAVFPFIIGALAERFGVSVLPPVLTVLLVCMLGGWIVVWTVVHTARKNGEAEREPLLAH